MLEIFLLVRHLHGQVKPLVRGMLEHGLSWLDLANVLIGMSVNSHQVVSLRQLVHLPSVVKGCELMSTDELLELLSLVHESRMVFHLI